MKEERLIVIMIACLFVLILINEYKGSRLETRIINVESAIKVLEQKIDQLK